MDKQDSTGRYTDYAIALWAVLVCILFITSSLIFASGSISDIKSILELIDISRYVYVVVLTVCVTGAALNLVRRLNGKEKI